MFGVDILLIALVVASLPVCIWRPWIGVLVFTWLGCMHPHRIVGGLADDLPLSRLVALATLLGLLFTRQRYALPRRRELYLLGGLWLTFLASTMLTALEPQRAWSDFVEVSKIMVMAGVTMVLFQDRAKLHALLLVIALSIGIVGIGGGLWGFYTGFHAPLFGPPHSNISDNNGLGFVLVVVLPLLAYVRQAEERAPLRALLLIAFGLSIIALFATYSRGAFVGFCLVLALIAVQIRTKDLALLGTGLAACLVFYLFAPQQWVERIETITPTAYRTDPSGVKRMKSWYVALRLGADHPFLGAGFRPFSPAVYQRYLAGYSDDHDAHSHFLQVFAEHGLIGLGLFVALLVSVLLRLWRLARLTRGDPHREWIGRCAQSVGVAVIAYVAGGMFINLPYFDLYYELVAVVVILQEIATSADGRACAPLDEGWVTAVIRRAQGITRQA